MVFTLRECTKCHPNLFPFMQMNFRYYLPCGIWELPRSKKVRYCISCK